MCAERHAVQLDVLALLGVDPPHARQRDKGLAELSVLKKRQLGEDVGTMRRLVWVGESYKDLAHGA